MGQAISRPQWSSWSLTQQAFDVHVNLGATLKVRISTVLGQDDFGHAFFNQPKVGVAHVDIVAYQNHVLEYGEQTDLSGRVLDRVVNVLETCLGI